MRSEAGKGSKRRQENFQLVQENWEGINWHQQRKLSNCCNYSVWVEGHTTHFYVCGNCDQPCDIK